MSQPQIERQARQLGTGFHADIILKEPQLIGVTQERVLHQVGQTKAQARWTNGRKDGAS
jgi:hypothetical protein